MAREKKREPIPQRIKTKLFIRSRGRCERCGLDLNKEGITPDFHHKDGNPKNNKFSNLIVVCPNCHRKLHDSERNRIFSTVRPKIKRSRSETKKSKQRRSESSGFDVLGSFSLSEALNNISLPKALGDVTLKDLSLNIKRSRKNMLEI